MVKIDQNLQLLAQDVVHELSILESRKHNQAVVCSNSGGLQSRSTPKRIGSCRKASSSLIPRGLRKSSSLTNGIGPGRNKTALREYDTEARGLRLSCDFVYAPILGTSVNGSL
jgi:site-specific recombinase XerC